MDAPVTPPTTDDRSAPPPRGRRLAIVLSVALLALGGAFAWWRESGRHLFIPKNFAPVDDGRVYRSGLIHRRLIEDTLEENGISTVVDLCGHGPTDPDVAAEREAAARLGIRAVDLPGLGGHGTGDPALYVQAVAEMARATPDRPVLVHCAGGTERTGAAVAIYRMLFEGWDGVRAYEEYVDFRGRDPENDELVDYLRARLPAVAEGLVRAGVLEEVPSPLPVFGPGPPR
jgi:protein tyrosine phosphatase (PTP) superfamily phosphohydrolase (DUF442 family)